jgi:glucokinase
VILAADVGATKILMEAGDLRSEGWRPALARRYPLAEFATFSAVMATFLDELAQVKPRARITAACVGAAGPALGNKVKMTHRPWTLDGAKLAREFAIPRVRVVNDLAAGAYGVALVGPRDLLTIQAGKAVAGEPQVVLGVGTGLGVAYLIPEGDRMKVVPGEGGHVGFGPASAAQLRLAAALFETRGRVEAEDVVSGRGLANIYQYLAQSTAAVDPAWISDRAANHGDDTCRAALDLMVECLGTIAGDHALAAMARGGVYIVGGVAAKIAPLIKQPRVVAAFCAKGAFSAMMMKIPLKVVTSERVPVLGAARFASLVIPA